MDLREAGKSRRRRQILDAARELIEAHGKDTLSMRRLAECAHLSTRTLYNLYGAKEDILYALMEESMRDLDATLSKLPLADPLDLSRALLSLAVDRVAAQTALNRALIRGIEIGAAGHSRDTALVNLARTRHAAVLAEAQDQGLLQRNASPSLLAHHIVMAYGQAARLWSREAIDAAEFKAHALHARALYLLAVAAPQARPRLEREIDALGPEVQALIQRLETMAGPSASVLATRERTRLTGM